MSDKPRNPEELITESTGTANEAVVAEGVAAGPGFAKARVGGLASATLSGIAWLTAQSVLGKFLSIIGQVILARLLLRDDWGMVGLAYTVATIAAVIAGPPIDDILVQRQEKRRGIMSAAMWFASVSGLLAAILMLLIAPFAARAYGSEQLFGLIGVLAFTAAASGLSVVPLAELRARHDFRRLAIIGLQELFAIQFLTILFAWYGWGAYSFILPGAIVALVKSGYLLWLTRLSIRCSPQLRRWRLFIRDSGWLFVTRLCGAACAQGDYIVLGFFASKAVVGEYFFAFNLSTQFVRLVAGNLSTVLMSSFARIKDDHQRLSAAVGEAARLCAALVGPASTGLIVIAGPLVKCVYGSRWDGAISLVQIVTAGSLINASAWPVPAALIAAGRLKGYARTWVVALVIFAVVVPIATHLGGAVGTAWAVCGWQIATCCIMTALFARSWRGLLLPWLWSSRSVIASAIAALISIGILRFVMRGSGPEIGDAMKLAILGIFYGGTVVPLIVLLDRRSAIRMTNLLRPKIRSLLDRIRPRSESMSTVTRCV